MGKRAGDLERTCAAQLKLVVVLSDGVGTDAIAALLADLRANATRSGNPRILAAVHTYFAQIEALRVRSRVLAGIFLWPINCSTALQTYGSNPLLRTFLGPLDHDL